MHFTRSQKLAISGACLVAIVLAVGGYFASDWYYGKVEPVQVSAEGADTEDSSVLSRIEYFADGTQVPEHLLIPDKWLDFHTEDFDPQEWAEFEPHGRRIVEEVLANHNLKRPIGEIWDAYIDMEQTRKAEDDAAGKNWLSGGN